MLENIDPIWSYVLAIFENIDPILDKNTEHSPTRTRADATIYSYLANRPARVRCSPTALHRRVPVEGDATDICLCAARKHFQSRFQPSPDGDVVGRAARTRPDRAAKARQPDGESLARKGHTCDQVSVCGLSAPKGGITSGFAH